MSKFCAHGGHSVDENDFSIDRQKADGLASICKACAHKKYVNRYQSVKKSIAESKSQWLKDNLESITSRQEELRQLPLVKMVAERKNIVGYSHAHRRVRLQRGSADRFQCICGLSSKEWALVHTSKDILWEGGMPYSLNIFDYIPLCKACHDSYDHLDFSSRRNHQ